MIELDAQRAALRPGTIVDDAYRVLGHLGPGSMGEVYLAKDTNLDRKVALKLIAERHEAQLPRLLDQARAMARVRHENVVAVYAAGEHHGQPYFVMEHIPGTSLAEWLASRRDRVSTDTALDLLEQICRGVQALHDGGIVHRDIKPANVMLGPAFHACVTDLGLPATEHAELSPEHLNPTTCAISGTPRYMAPELVEVDRPHDALSDVYSLGVLAYELLVGRHPFQEPPTSDPIEMLKRHVHEAVPRPSGVTPALHDAFNEPLLCALDKDPDARTASAEALRCELAAAREQSTSVNPRVRVLVVDDDPDFRQLAAACVRTANPAAEVLSCASGRQALDALGDQPADLALLDLHMPTMNGGEVTAAIRDHEHGASLPILVITGRGTAADWRELSALGADGFLVKPVDPTALVFTIRRMLGST